MISAGIKSADEIEFDRRIAVERSVDSAAVRALLFGGCDKQSFMRNAAALVRARGYGCADSRNDVCHIEIFVYDPERTLDRVACRSRSLHRRIADNVIAFFGKFAICGYCSERASVLTVLDFCDRFRRGIGKRYERSRRNGYSFSGCVHTCKRSVHRDLRNIRVSRVPRGCCHALYKFLRKVVSRAVIYDRFEKDIICRFVRLNAELYVESVFKVYLFKSVELAFAVGRSVNIAVESGKRGFRLVCRTMTGRRNGKHAAAVPVEEKFAYRRIFLPHPRINDTVIRRITAVFLFFFENFFGIIVSRGTIMTFVVSHRRAGVPAVLRVLDGEIIRRIVRIDKLEVNRRCRCLIARSRRRKLNRRAALRKNSVDFAAVCALLFGGFDKQSFMRNAAALVRVRGYGCAGNGNRTRVVEILVYNHERILYRVTGKRRTLDCGIAKFVRSRGFENFACRRLVIGRATVRRIFGFRAHRRVAAAHGERITCFRNGKTVFVFSLDYVVAERNLRDFRVLGKPTRFRRGGCVLERERFARAVGVYGRYRFEKDIICRFVRLNAELYVESVFKVYLFKSVELAFAVGRSVNIAVESGKRGFRLVCRTMTGRRNGKHAAAVPVEEKFAYRRIFLPHPRINDTVIRRITAVFLFFFENFFGIIVSRGTIMTFVVSHRRAGVPAVLRVLDGEIIRRIVRIDKLEVNRRCRCLIARSRRRKLNRRAALRKNSVDFAVVRAACGFGRNK